MIKNIYKAVFTFLLISIGFNTYGQCPTDANATISVTDETCFEFKDGIIEVTFGDGTPPYDNVTLFDLFLGQFVQMPLGPVNVNQPTPNSVIFSNVPPSLYVVRVFKNTPNCSSVIGGAGITVNAAAELIVSTNSITSACIPGTGEINLDVTGGTGGYNFAWSGPTAIGDVEDPIGLDAGTYSVDVTDANACLVTHADIVVPAPPLSAQNPVSSSYCQGDPVTSVSVDDPGAGFRIDWYDNMIGGAIVGTGATLSPGVPGTYYAEIVDETTLCTSIVRVAATITENLTATAAILVGDATICLGDNTDLAIIITGGTGPFTIEIDNGVGIINNYNSGALINVAPAVTTTYNIVSVIDATSCPAQNQSGTATVTIGNPTDAVLGSDATICAGDNTDLSVTIAGGTGPFTIEIDNGVGVIPNYISGDAIPVSPAISTTYNLISVSDASGCPTLAQSGTAVITVNQPATAAVLSGDNTICAGDNTDLMLTITDGTAPFTIEIDNGVGVINAYNSGDAIPVSPIANTTYNIVSVTDAAGCTALNQSGTATIVVNPSATDAVFGSDGVMCQGQDGTLSVTITGGLGPFTIEIDNGIGVFNNYNSGDPITVSPLATTTYALINIVDANGCPPQNISGTPTITVSPAATDAVLGSDATICAGEDGILSVTITGGTAPYTIELDNGVGIINNYNSGDPITVTPGATTTYNLLSAIDAGACPAQNLSGTPTITVNPSATQSVLGSDDTICEGDNATISVVVTGGTGPFTIEIDNGVGVIPNYNSGDPIVVTPGSTTIYNLISVVDANSCPSQNQGGTATITVNPLATAAVLGSDATICAGDNANLEVIIAGGTGPFTIEIDNGVGVINAYNSGDPIAVAPGATTTYNLVSVTDANGCSAQNQSGTATITISTPATAAVLSGDATICAGDNTNLTLTVTGGTAPFTVEINNGVGVINAYNSGDAIIVSPAANTTYNIISVVDAAGCPAQNQSGTPTVTVTPAATAAVLGSDATICAGDNIDLSVAITGGTGPFTIELDQGIGVIANYNSGDPINVAPGVTTTYTLLSVVDANACPAQNQSGTATITIGNPTDAILGSDATICLGDDAFLSVNITGGTGPFTIEIDNGVGVINAYNSGDQITVSPIVNTTYNLVSVTDANGCGSLNISGSAAITFQAVQGDPTVYGNETWIGYVYDDSADPAAYPGRVDYSNTKYKGFIDESDITIIPTGFYDGASDQFDLDIQNGSVFGPNLCTAYDDNFSIRYRMEKTFAEGVYIFTVGADDGVRLLVDGVNVLDPTAFTDHVYTEYVSVPVCLNGLHELDIEYYENTNNSRISFLYQTVFGPSSASPVEACLNGAEPTLTATGDGDDLNWYNAANVLIGTGSPFTIPAAEIDMTTIGTTLFSVSSTYACGGESPKTTVIVSIVDGPISNLTLNKTLDPLCVGGVSDVIIENSQLGVTYQLRDDADDSNVGTSVLGTGADLVIPTGALNVTTTFNVLATNASCPSIELDNTITINVAGNIDATLVINAIPNTVCTGDNAQIEIQNSEVGVDYQLRNDADNSNIGAAVTGTGGTITFDLLGVTADATYNVLAVSVACSIVMDTKPSITVVPNMTTALNLTANPAALCAGGSSDITLENPDFGISYQLRDAANVNVGAPLVGGFGDLIFPTGVITATTTFNILASNGGVCPDVQIANTVEVTVVSDPDGTLPVAANIMNLCIGGATEVTVANSEMSVSYQLFDGVTPVGTPVNGDGNTISLPTGNLVVPTTFSVQATRVGCTVVTLDNTVTINVAGNINNALVVIVADPNLCSGSNTSVVITNTEVGVTYQVKDDLGNDIGTPIIGDGTTQSVTTAALTLDTTFEVLATNGVCSLTLADMPTVMVVAGPGINMAVTAVNPSVCINSPSSISVANSEIGVMYQLQTDAGVDVGVPVAGDGAATILITDPLLVATTFKVIATVAGCPPMELTNKATVTILAATDPACSGTMNCGVFVIKVTEVRPTCASNDDGVLTFDITGGLGNYVVTLTDNNGFNKGETGNTTTPVIFSDLSAADYTYTVSDGTNNCTLPYSLVRETVVQATATSFVDAACFDQTVGMATISITQGGNAPYEYSSDAGVSWNTIPADNIAKDLPPLGTYNILVRDDATDTCPAEVSVTINNANTEIIATFTTSEATCDNGGGSIQITNVSGGVGPYTYRLDGDDYATLPASFDDLTGGTHTFTVIDTGIAGCEKDIDIFVPAPGLVIFTTTITNPTCTENAQNGVIRVDIDAAHLPGAYQAAISTSFDIDGEFKDVPASGVMEFLGLPVGRYYITVKSVVDDCPNKVAVDIDNGPIALSFDLEIECYEDKQAVLLTNIVAESGVDFNIEIYKVGDIIPVQVITLTDIPAGKLFRIKDLDFLTVPGNYQLALVQQQTVCVNMMTSPVSNFSIQAALSATLGEVTTSFPERGTGTITINNIIGGAGGYEIMIEPVGGSWITVEQSNTSFEYDYQFTDLLPGVYDVIVRDSLGCEITFAAEVPRDTALFIPNVFTPNGDGTNDAFFIRNLPASGTKLRISNRLGRKVFEATDYKNDWDGESNSDGIYYYTLVIDGNKMSGWIEIFRAGINK